MQSLTAINYRTRQDIIQVKKKISVEHTKSLNTDSIETQDWQQVKPETETKTDYEQYFEKVETFFYKSAIDAHLGGGGDTSCTLSKDFEK